MRTHRDPLLAPGASKETALHLIRSGIEMKGGAASAGRIAKECIARGFLLSHEERLLVGFAILVGLTRKEDVEVGEATWRLAAAPLLKHGKAPVVLHYALRIFSTGLARKQYPKARKGLEKARPAAEKLPAHNAGVLQYAACIEEYVHLSGDIEGGERLKLN